MDARDARCDGLSHLVGSWHTGTMREADRNGYEQHLLFCPPCMVQNQKAGLAFAALRSAGPGGPAVHLVDRLTARLPAADGGP